MRKLFLIIPIVLLAGIAYADFTVETAADSFAVNGITTVYTTSFPIKSNTNNNIGVMYKMDSAVTGDININFQQSYQPPTTENAADSAWINTQNVGSTDDGDWHIATLDTVIMPYGRFQIVGSAENPATTTVDIKISKE